MERLYFFGTGMFHNENVSYEKGVLITKGLHDIEIEDVYVNNATGRIAYSDMGFPGDFVITHDYIDDRLVPSRSLKDEKKGGNQ
jgi:purine nucleoside phosphorylase